MEEEVKKKQKEEQAKKEEKEKMKMEEEVKKVQEEKDKDKMGEEEKLWTTYSLILQDMRLYVYFPRYRIISVIIMTLRCKTGIKSATIDP